MKKLIALIILMAVLVSIGVLAEERGPEDAPKGMDNNTGMQPELYANGTDAPGKVIAPGPEAMDKAKSVDAIKEQLQEMQQAMEQDMQSMGDDTQKAYQNQNEVRLAVHALQALGDMTGGVGKNISALAKEFNNSVQATLQAEERIEKKSGFARFFTGGDKEAGQSLAEEATKNQERIQELKQLQEDCDCDESVKQMLQEQVQTMEQEQARLQELAEKEQKKKGLLGWIWK